MVTQNDNSARGVEIMKTQTEIEELKRNWKSDPCWDIEETEDNIKLVNCIRLLKNHLKSLEERLYSLENITEE